MQGNRGKDGPPWPALQSPVTVIPWWAGYQSTWSAWSEALSSPTGRQKGMGTGCDNTKDGALALPSRTKKTPLKFGITLVIIWEELPRGPVRDLLFSDKFSLNAGSGAQVKFRKGQSNSFVLMMVPLASSGIITMWAEVIYAPARKSHRVFLSS